ncbi:hypothetical protein DI005_01670 [Prauserella sp. PE36]|uniref:DUF6049 family protein n=1 Tax=Prauserella sp. PE36 TaxID=1504709 RepID=UPI000DE379F3|nr:DUF6049 family protein [Prauserella sp. PE36]RBM23683.1 hypothetical protein DI005_01670 [Prauserella sp. PE36]
MNKLSAFALALALCIAQGLLGVTGSAAQPLDTPNRLRLDLEQLSPRIVTPQEDTLVVTGNVTNVGDRPITEIVARLQLGAPQTSDDELEQTLTEAPPTDSGASEWESVADTLQPGDTARVTLTVPIDQLPLSAPGVYPLLVNVNGTPAYGGAARLASVSTLLPVIDPPSEAAPASVSMLWPITSSKPQVVSSPHGGPLVLADDILAAELKPGGRLDALVAAAASQRDNPAVFGSLCFAIDPELLDTVELMSRGYQVRTPSGELPGSGREAAAEWLEKLRDLVAAHCVIQLPYADADLTAVSRVNTATDLVGTALNGTSILQKLGVQPKPGLVWPGSALDETALRRVADAGVTTLITDPLQQASRHPGVRSLPYDSLTSVALGGARSTATSAQTPADQPNIATQNGIAALAFHAGLGEEPEGPVLVAPPRRWDAPVGELAAFLDSFAGLQAAGMVEPTSLDEVLAGPPEDGAAADGDTGTLDSAFSVPGDVIAELSELESVAADLQGAMSVDPTRQVQPAAIIQPLHNAVLRATSTAWQSSSSLGKAAARAATAQLTTLRRQVTVTTLSQSVSLASGSSPLPVTLSNSLPVAITVRIRLENNAGLRPAHMPDSLLSANSKIPQYIPAEALRSGRFNLDVSLTTPGGTELGTPARLDFSSSELGVVTVVLTATAAGALVLLSGRRIYRRLKARKGT